jgi:hypothetical protein
VHDVTFLHLDALGTVAEVVFIEFFPELFEPFCEHAEDGWVLYAYPVLADFLVGEQRHVLWNFAADEEGSVLFNARFVFLLLFFLAQGLLPLLSVLLFLLFPLLVAPLSFLGSFYAEYSMKRIVLQLKLLASFKVGLALLTFLVPLDKPCKTESIFD